MLNGKKEFVAALVVIVIVLVTLALPYVLTEAYGLQVKNLILFMQVVLAFFSAGMSIWWLVRYRQTSHDIETLREEIGLKIRGRNEREHDSSEGRNRDGHKRK